MSLHPELCGLMELEHSLGKGCEGNCVQGRRQLQKGQHMSFPGLLGEGGLWGPWSLQVTIVCVQSTEAEGLVPDGVVSKLWELDKVGFIALAVEPLKLKGLLCCEIKALRSLLASEKF